MILEVVPEGINAVRVFSSDGAFTVHGHERILLRFFRCGGLTPTVRIARTVPSHER